MFILGIRAYKLGILMNFPCDRGQIIRVAKETPATCTCVCRQFPFPSLVWHYRNTGLADSLEEPSCADVPATPKHLRALV